ncbi:MAG: hypothetical protein PHQ19_07020 [Candidatus Krumholzibacteria bacterium]|nr:hypothetical protein [Candidatus Krumholzibacteria bacterium]
MRWTERRRRIYRMIAEAFSARTSISTDDFTAIYLEPGSPPSIGDFEAQYVPDRETLETILEGLGEACGAGAEKAAAHYDRRESFVRYAEHLLRSGALGGEEE